MGKNIYENIDFVVPWVDGSDAKWLAEKNKYMSVSIDDTNADYRFRDWGILKYWFRSIEKNAPWFRKIHFITYGHLPDFLDVNNPKINIVNHKDYIPEQYLPTFNSNVIEMNMYRIKGLSEHFVCFNDDMYINKPVRPEDFFDSEGHPCLYYVEQPFLFADKTKAWALMLRNNLQIINKHFNKRESFNKYKTKYYSNKFSLFDKLISMSNRLIAPDMWLGFPYYDCPTPTLKSTIQEVWDKEYDILDKTSKNKFRSGEDVNVWLLSWWELASGNFQPHSLNDGFYWINKFFIRQICKDICNQRNDFICLNDEQKTMDYKLQSLLINAFEEAYPEKSSFEK